MRFNWKKDFLPHLLAIVIFIVLAFVYCSPLLQGETVNQYDMTQVEGMSHESKLYYEKTGEHPLWTNSMFSGMPSYLIYTGPSSNLVRVLNQVTTLWLPSPVNMLFIAMLGVYFLLCVMKLKYPVCLFGAVAYGFSSYNVILIQAGHITKLMSMAWMAPLLAGVWLVYRRKYILGGAVTALSSALMIYNNHIQVIYYTLIVLGFFILYQLVLAGKRKEWGHFLKAAAVCIIAGILGALPASDNLLVTQEYTPYSIRGSHSELTMENKVDQQYEKGGLGIEYAFRWSLGKLETFSILIPNIFGGPPPSDDFIASSETFQKITQMGAGQQQAANVASRSLYWGPQPFTTPIYFGALVCFLFLLAFFAVKSPHRWWILAVSVLGIFMAWGKNLPAFNNFLFNHLPLYNKFRSPSMTMVIPQLTFVLLGSWGLHELLSGKLSKKEAWDAVKKSFYIMAGLIILLSFIPGAMLGYSGPNDGPMQQAGAEIMRAIRSDRASLLHKDALRSFILVALFFAALWALVKDYVKPMPFLAIAGALLLFDLFQVDKRYLNDQNFSPDGELSNQFPASPADQQIMQDTTDFRVLNLGGDTFNEAMTSYHHQSIGGYNPAKLWRYQDLIDFQIQPEIQRIASSLQGKTSLDSSVMAAFQSSPVLNMLNTKYFLLGAGNPPVRNEAALGSAWFVRDIRWVPNADSEMVALSHFDPEQTAIIDQRAKSVLDDFHPAADSVARIRLVKKSPNEMRYASSNGGEGLGVFSAVYYPAGWKAFIDGKETPILRVNYLLRALRIPPGDHDITFKFHPDIYYTGQKISGITSLLLILLVFGAIGWEIFGRKGPIAPVEDKP